MTTTAYIVAYPHPKVPSHSSVWQLRLDSEASGDTLVEQLCDIYPDHCDDLKGATLWKVLELATADAKSSKQKTHQWIKEREKHPENEIEAYHFVEDHFPDHPRLPSRDWVDIVVVTPEIIEDMDYPGDVDGNLKHMDARVALSRMMRTIGSPSEIVKDPVAIKNVIEGPAGPRYGRPHNRYGPPTALFSRELALLRYDLEHLEAFQPNSADIERAFDLIENAVSVSDEEGKREAGLRSFLGGLLAGKRQWHVPIDDGSAKPYGVWLEGSCAYLIVEVKNEEGFGGDPFLQGLLMYSKIIAQEKYHRFLKRSNLPVVLLAIAGNRLTVSTAIFTDSVYADELVSMGLHFRSNASDNVLRVARTFMAINRCTERLRGLYRNLERSIGTIPAAKVMWPNPTVDPSEPVEGAEELEFFSKVDRLLGTPINQTPIDEANKRHGIYLARMRTGGSASTMDVLVKFTAKYNAAAHRLLANHDPPLAPPLYSCKRVIGEVFMVVMQYIPQLEGASLRGASLPPSALEVVRRDVSCALELLHGQNLVFGDIQESNVLYLPDDGRALLVGFDNVGRDGEDMYFSCHGLVWQIMEKSHDVEGLGRLVDWLSRLL